MDKGFRIEGMDEFLEAVDKLVESTRPDKAEPILHKGAQKMTKALRENAPEGPSSNLKKAIKTKKLQRWGKNPAPSIAAVDRKKAPHVHLVEHGTSGVRPVDPPHYTSFGGKVVKITNTGRMPPNPFFRRTVESMTSTILDFYEREFGKLIDEGMK